MLDRYLEIKAQISALEEELEALKAPLLYALMDEPEDRVQHRGFDVVITRRKSYTYSDDVQNLETHLKEVKAHERSTGIAEVTKQQAILVVRPARMEE